MCWLSVVRVAVVNRFSSVGCLSLEVQRSMRPTVAYTVVADSPQVDDTVPWFW